MDWRGFHEFTNHAPNHPGGRVQDPARPRSMDPERRPEPFKTYEGSPETLPLEWGLERWISGERNTGVMDANELSRILLLGAGAKKYRSGRLRGRYFRTYASAGALHPNEVYLAIPDVPGIDAGLFHLDTKARGLTRLGVGDARSAIGRAANDRELGTMQALVVISGIHWRTAWKYGPRGYRHLWWDAGMIIANLLALAAAGNRPTKVACMFEDAAMNDLLGIDGRTEMALAVVGIGDSVEHGDTTYAALNLNPASLGPDPFEYPEVSEVHAATSPEPVAKVVPPTTISQPSGPPVEGIIWKRGSARQFDEGGTATADQLFEILRYADQPLAGDWGDRTIQLFLIAHAVAGLEPGAYRWDVAELTLLRTDPESRDSGYFLSLDQELGSDGVATIFPMADLEEVTGSLGPRGYRAAQLEGAIRSGLIYLAAYGLGLGASGLTFYDQEVSRYFGVGSVPMLEVAIGTPLKAKPLPEPSEVPLNLDLADPSLENDVPRGWRGRIKGYGCVVENGTLKVHSASKRESWCNVGHTVKCEEYRGHSVRFSADVATRLGNNAWAGLYMTVNDKSRAPMHLDNMEDRPIKEHTAFSRYVIELPVEEGAESISFGILLIGQGEAEIKALKLEML